MEIKELKIITPSYKRADNIKAKEVFGDKLIIACHEFEEKEYRENNPENELMVLPDSLRWNMAKVRNYMKDNCNSKYLLMIDDDVREIGYFENSEKHKFERLDEILDFIEKWYNLAEELGTCLWGMQLNDDRLCYREYSPFSFHSPILWPFSWHIVDKDLHYDERLGLNEDYDYFIQCINKYRKVLRFNKYYYVAGHLTDKWGCGAYRLLDNERKQAEIMMKKWWKKVVKYNLGKSTNPIIHIPIKGI